MAKIVKPINNSPTPKLERICNAPSVINHAAKIKEIMESTSLNMAQLSFSIESSDSNSSLDLYHERIVLMSNVNNMIEDTK